MSQAAELDDLIEPVGANTTRINSTETVRLSSPCVSKV